MAQTGRSGVSGRGAWRGGGWGGALCRRRAASLSSQTPPSLALLAASTSTISSLSQHGKTAMDIAKEKNHTEVVWLLTAEKAAALGLRQPLEVLSLGANALRKVTVAAVTYCDAQGADSFADLAKRASKLIAHPQHHLIALEPACGSRGPELWPCDVPAYEPWRLVVQGDTPGALLAGLLYPEHTSKTVYWVCSVRRVGC